MLSIDLSDCDISYEIDPDPDILPDDVWKIIIPYLNKERWVIVLASENSQEKTDSLNNSHFQSVIITYIRFHSEKTVLTVPLKSLTGPWFVIYHEAIILHI